MTKAVWLAALGLSAAVSSVSFAQVTGRVTLDGEAPEPAEIDMSGVPECAAIHADPVLDPSITVGADGGLANVIVAIQTDDPDSLGGEAPSEPVVLDQEGCMYHPHVLTITTGQDFVVKNSDPFLHNVHSLSQTNPAFNFGQPNVDPGKKAPSPKAAERFRVKCDVHPWMSAYVGVFEHPFHAVTDESGAFALPEGLPDGEYTVLLWHEKLGEKEATIEVTDGKAELTESFSAAGAMAPVVPDVRLAAMVTEAAGATCATAESCCATGATDTEVASDAAPVDAQAKVE